MGLRFEKKIGLQFGLVTCLLVLVGVMAYAYLAVDTRNARQVEHALETLRALDRVLSLVQDAETGQLGYVLTGREGYREPFDLAAADLDRALDALGALIRDQPGGLARLRELRYLVGQKVAGLRDTIDGRRGGLDAVLPIILTDHGKWLMDQIRGQIARMQQEQRVALAGLSARVGGGARRAVIVSDVGVALTLAVLGFAFRLIVGELSARRRAEAALSGMAAIIASTDDAVIGMALDGTLTSWNAAAERLLGYPAAEALGRRIDDFLPPDRHGNAAGVLARIARGEALGHLESVGLRKDGSPVDVEVRVSPIRGEGGAIVGASTIARDVTARKRAEALLRERTDALEAARARLAAAAEFAAALNQPGVLETYRATLGCLARVARASLAVLYDVAEAGGEVPRARCAVGPDLLPLDSAALRGDGLPASVARTGAPAELTGPFDDPALRTRFGLGDLALGSVLGWPVAFRGRTLGVLVTAHAAPPDAERRAFVAAALDQLAVRMDGFQVEQQRLRLLSDLRGQSRALEAARQESERANRSKSEFLAAMSHELRTPMNSILGFTARLLRKLGPTLGERELDALMTVDRNARHLLVLINDVLDLSKIEAGRMAARAEPFDLAALAREAAGQSAPLFDGKPVELVLDLPDPPVAVEADPKLVRQVALNFLSNAAKFTDRGTVTVSAAGVLDPALGDAVRLSVRDTGIGIAPADRARLFQRFCQLDGGPGRKAGGTGLGLALSEGMARLHGGRIDVSSVPGVGSEFALVLPREIRPAPARVRVPSAAPCAPADPAPAPPPAPGGCPAPAPGDDPREGTILCVDDEPDALKYLRLTFEDAGYRVLTAGGHDDALACARARRPDLICLDLAMPGKNGFEFVRTLRADPVLADVPVLIVSATSEEARALRAGARRYLAKPAEADALVEAAHELLGDGPAAPGGGLLVGAVLHALRPRRPSPPPPPAPAPAPAPAEAEVEASPA